MFTFRDDPWLAQLFGHPVHRLEADFKLRPHADAVRRDLGAHTARHSPDFVYAKVDADRIDWVVALTEAGFHPVDVNLTFGSGSADVRAAPRPREETDPVAVREATPRDHAAALEIAQTSFRYSRFHLDPHIDAGLANRIKRAWIQSYIDGRRGEALYVAARDGNVLGFLAVNRSDADGLRVRNIDLIGVQTRAQSTGVGRRLVRFFLEDLGAECDRMTVGTQAANLPSVRLYESAGMRLERAQYVLHHHSPSGSP